MTSGAIVLARAMRAEELKERGIAQVFFEIRALIQILGINLRHRQTVAAKMAGELEKSDILFAHRIENADGVMAASVKTSNDAPRAAELPLQRLHAFRRRMKMLLEEAF